MRIGAFALSAACAAAIASLATAATARPLTQPHVRKHAVALLAGTVHPNRDPRGGWGGSEWYTKGWGGWGWGYGPGQGLLAGALVGEGVSVPYHDFTFGYPKHRRYPYVAFPYGVGYPYYNISYGYYRPPTPQD
jgi:hypothetical protein